MNGFSLIRPRGISFLRQAFLIASCLCLLMACKPDELNDTLPAPPADDARVGFTTVALDANRAVIRAREAVLGNLVADAVLQGALAQGAVADFAVMNGGSIRVNFNRHADGVYPEGELTRQDILDMQPFNNTGVLVTASGADIKEVFERSVAQLPAPDPNNPHGAFLQVSQGVEIVCDLSRQAQIITQATDGTVIVTPGDRIVSLRINGVAANPAGNYRFVVSSFIAAGGDGYATLANLPASAKQDLGVDTAVWLENYVRNNSPVAPVLNQRIQFVEAIGTP